jgi:integrase
MCYYSGMETFHEFSDRYKSTILPLKKKATQHTFKSHIKSLNEAFGGCPLADIDHKTIQAVFSNFAKTLEPASVRNLHGTYRLLLSQAKREGIVEEFPKPVLPRAKRVQQDWLRLDQMRDIIRAADTKHKAFVALLAEVGPRVGEAFGLRVEDLTGQTLYIQRSIFMKDAQDPKTDNAFRRLYVSEQLVELLRGRADSGYFFKTRNGGPWWQTYTRVYTDSLLRSLNIEPVGFHAWRRGNATALASQFAVPTKIIGDRLGHSHKDLTLGCYAQTIEGSDKPYIDAYAKELYG